MHTTGKLLLTGALALIGAEGCSSGGPASGDPTFPATAAITMSTTSGALHVAVRTAPSQPPTLGQTDAQYTITNASGAPADGLTVTVVPWMPKMGHGASTTPTVAAQGNGVYLISDLEMFMPGEWDLRTTITGAASDSITPSFDLE